MKAKKTLILTDSHDATSDLLIRCIGAENVFRLNYDLWQDYFFEVKDTGIIIGVLSSNEVLQEEEVEKVLWRKPFHSTLVCNWSNAELTTYIEHELKYIFREVFNLFCYKGKTILVRPQDDRRVGKMLQLTIANNIFRIPHFQVSWNRGIAIRNPVVKSLSSEMLGEKVIYTTPVQAEHLDSEFPWFVNEKIDGVDVTVVYVDGDVFAYSLERNFEGYDWRKHIQKGNLRWKKEELSTKETEQIRAFMRACKLKFGRLDFLRDKQGELFFLEVNPNGQWAFLDTENQNGLLKRMVEEVSPLTNRRTVVEFV